MYMMQICMITTSTSAISTAATRPHHLPVLFLHMGCRHTVALSFSLRSTCFEVDNTDPATCTLLHPRDRPRQFNSGEIGMPGGNNAGRGGPRDVCQM